MSLNKIGWANLPLKDFYSYKEMGRKWERETENFSDLFHESWLSVNIDSRNPNEKYKLNSVEGGCVFRDSL